MRVRISRMEAGAALPRYARTGDGGMDLCSTEATVLLPWRRASMGTSLCVEIPDGYVGLIVPRSGLALEMGITVLNSPGVLDSGYRGEVRIILMNLSSEAVELPRGARIAQLLIVAVPPVEFEEVPELLPTSRGGKGFGSTGL